MTRPKGRQIEMSFLAVTLDRLRSVGLIATMRTPADDVARNDAPLGKLKSGFVLRIAAPYTDIV